MAWGEQQPPPNWQGASSWMALVFSASLPTPESPPPPFLPPPPPFAPLPPLLVHLSSPWLISSC